MLIHCVPSGPIDTNAYILIDSTNNCAIIDPGVDSQDAIVKIISEKKAIPKVILLTHSHWDHIGDVAFLHEHYSIPVYVHAEDSQNLEKPGSDGVPCWLEIKGMKPSRFVSDGEEIILGNSKLTVIHTPGHSPGSVCYYCQKSHILISGDALFAGSMGSLSLPTSQPNRMWPSLEKLSILPKETKVYPGHGCDTTIGKETWLKDAKSIFGY